MCVVPLWKKQYPAADLPLLKGRMRLGRIRHRISAVDSDGKFPLLFPVNEMLQVVRIFLEVGTAVRASEKQRSFFLQPHKIKRRHIPAGLAIYYEISTRRQAIEARLKGISADAVVNHADASPPGHPSRFLRNVRLLGNDNLVRASLSNKLGLLRRRRNPNHPSLADLCHLAKQKSNASRRCLDQAPVSRFHRVGKMGERISQKSLVHSRRCLLGVDAVRHWDQPRGRSESMRRVRIPNEHNALSHVNLPDLGTKFFHDPDSLAAHSCRKVRFIVTRAAIESLPHKFAPP